jgi:hypothetical protein
VAAPNTLVLDACVAITFGNAARLDLVTGMAGWRVAIGARARVEVARDPAAGQLRAAIEDGSLSVAAIDLGVPAEASALADFDRRPAFRGRGEAEVLALARSRGYAVGSDERAVLTAARSEFGARPRVLQPRASRRRATGEADRARCRERAARAARHRSADHPLPGDAREIAGRPDLT